MQSHDPILIEKCTYNPHNRMMLDEKGMQHNKIHVKEMIKDCRQNVINNYISQMQDDMPAYTKYISMVESSLQYLLVQIIYDFKVGYDTQKDFFEKVNQECQNICTKISESVPSLTMLRSIVIRINNAMCSIFKFFVNFVILQVGKRCFNGVILDGKIANHVGKIGKDSILSPIQENIQRLVTTAVDQIRFVSEYLNIDASKLANLPRMVDTDNFGTYVSTILTKIQVLFLSKVGAFSIFGYVFNFLVRIYEYIERSDKIPAFDRTPAGLKWKGCGTDMPEGSRLLTNDKLAKALEEKQKFTRQEWEAFGIKDLQTNDVVKVGSQYFKPVGTPAATKIQIQNEIDAFVQEMFNFVRNESQTTPSQVDYQKMKVLQYLLEKNDCEAVPVDDNAVAEEAKKMLFDGRATEALPAGLKWEGCGTEMPQGSQLLKNAKLTKALKKKKEFTREEWDAFGISDLRTNHVVKVRREHFKPVALLTNRHLCAYFRLPTFEMFKPGPEGYFIPDDDWPSERKVSQIL